MGKKKRQLRDLGDRSPEQFAAATALTELIQDFVRESASVDIPFALGGCKKAQLERLLASVRSASEWLKDLLGGEDAPDRPVGRRAERISGGEVAGQRNMEIVVAECASKPDALKQASVTATEPERLAFAEAASGGTAEPRRRRKDGGAGQRRHRV
jgi:hypothetical protein